MKSEEEDQSNIWCNSVKAEKMPFDSLTLRWINPILGPQKRIIMQLAQSFSAGGPWFFCRSRNEQCLKNLHRIMYVHYAYDVHDACLLAYSIWLINNCWEIIFWRKMTTNSLQIIWSPFKCLDFLDLNYLKYANKWQHCPLSAIYLFKCFDCLIVCHFNNQLRKLLFFYECE